MTEVPTTSRNTAFVAVLKSSGLALWATLSSNPSRVTSSMKSFQGEDSEAYETHKVSLYRVWADQDGAIKPPPRHHVLAYSLVKKKHGRDYGKVLKRTYLTTSMTTLSARYTKNQASCSTPVSLPVAISLGEVAVAYYHARVTSEKWQKDEKN